VVEARLNGGRCGEPNVYQLEAPLREAQPAPGGLVLQLRAGERTLGVVAAPLLASAGAATLARFAAEQAPRLPLAAAVRALSPWSSPVFWRAALRELAQLRGLALKGQRRNRAMLKQILARRLRHAVRSGLDAEVRYRLRGALHQSDGDAHTAALAELRRQAELPPAPTVQSRSDLGSTTPGGRAQAVDRPESWDAFFDAADPWNYGGSHYERIKYEDTLELIPHAPSARALELACAEGHFTTRLATRVGALVASDISAKALARAQARAEGVDNVEFRQLDFMGQEIPGTYDLIVCSEVLYYAGDRLAQVAGKIADRLNPGGRLVMTHANQIADEPEATGFDWGHSFGAKTICEVFAAVPGLILETEIRRPLYRVQSFVKADGATGYAEPRREQRPLTVELERHVARNVVWGGGVSRIAAFGREVATSAPILMYHRVAPTGPAALDRYRVSPDAFDAQIGALRRLGYWGVTPERLVEALSTARPLPGRPVMITVDDGYEDFRDFAWPILKRHDFPATLFVVSEKAGQRADWDADVAEPAPLLGWEDLARLAAEGVCIESHGGSHRPLTRLSVDDVYLELLRARRVIELVTGRAPTALCYPYGAQDGIVEQIARDCGYQLGFGVQQGHALITGDPWRLPRVEVSGHDDMATFLRKIGRPDTLKALRSLAV
jgi:peptidoglycan/xylan/chitin deacetylase (PgdA/CDA1 family)/2-polyprenyl-3-methyl-5-hydroxy-6-metoxy-1,4-benzoquinol methylase